MLAVGALMLKVPANGLKNTPIVRQDNSSTVYVQQPGQGLQSQNVNLKESLNIKSSLVTLANVQLPHTTSCSLAQDFLTWKINVIRLSSGIVAVIIVLKSNAISGLHKHVASIVVHTRERGVAGHKFVVCKPAPVQQLKRMPWGHGCRGSQSAQTGAAAGHFAF